MFKMLAISTHARTLSVAFSTPAGLSSVEFIRPNIGELCVKSSKFHVVLLNLTALVDS